MLLLSSGDLPMQLNLLFMQFWWVLGKRGGFDAMQFDALCLFKVLLSLFFISGHLSNSNVRRTVEIFMLCF